VLSVRNWSRFPRSARFLLGAFEVLQAADGLTASALADFAGREVAEPGNLKLAAPPPAIDTAAFETLAKLLAKRPIWLAASTHEGEEALALDAHSSLILGDRNALLILAPRHPDRALAVQLLIERSGLVSARRSEGGLPTPATQVWHWDTLGELGLAFALASVTLVAGSLVPGIGGHNPVEPVQLGSAVVTGPYTVSFDDLMGTFEEAGGARILRTPSANALAMTVAGLWGNADIRARQCAAALGVVASNKGSLGQAVEGVLSLLKAAP
jgi:3-deoxy-D-manno-octulosonic-acid transferase